MLSFYFKFWTDRWTGIKTDRRTQVKQFTPNLSMWDIKTVVFAGVI